MHKAMLKRLMPMVVFVLVWGGLLAGDWFFRFNLFRWQDRLIRQPVVETEVARGPYAPMMQKEVSAFTGGDLTRLAAVDEVTERFGEEKPTTIVVTDEHGYRNSPPTDGKRYPVMVVGDSFLDVQYGSDGNFVRLLERELGKPVYNHSYPGAGAFWGLHRYLIEQRFKQRPPEVMVWGLLERELGGSLFAGYVYHIRKLNDREVAEAPTAATGVAWDQLQPKNLAASLPSTSFMAAGARRLWNVLRYPVFGAITSDVILSEKDQTGSDYLFYRYNLMALAWTEQERNPSQIAWSLEFIRNYLREQGTELMIMLIPDKEQVYRELIPDGDHLPLSTLYDLEQALLAMNIPVINLLPGFLAAKENGIPLYWRDDTHWRTEAMKIAAEMVGERIRSEVRGQRSGVRSQMKYSYSHHTYSPHTYSNTPTRKTDNHKKKVSSEHVCYIRSDTPCFNTLFMRW